MTLILERSEVLFSRYSLKREMAYSTYTYIGKYGPIFWLGHTLEHEKYKEAVEAPASKFEGEGGGKILIGHQLGPLCATKCPIFFVSHMFGGNWGDKNKISPRCL